MGLGRLVEEVVMVWWEELIFFNSGSADWMLFECCVAMAVKSKRGFVPDVPQTEFDMLVVSF